MKTDRKAIHGIHLMTESLNMQLQNGISKDVILKPF
jgi:hypothetical protein